jgi:hypothetical protein
MDYYTLEETIRIRDKDSAPLTKYIYYVKVNLNFRSFCDCIGYKDF